MRETEQLKRSRDHAYLSTYVPATQENIWAVETDKQRREHELVQACQRLQVGEHTQRRAVDLLRNLQDRASPDDLQRLDHLWQACIIFLESRLVREESRGAAARFVPLWRILGDCGIRLTDFMAKYKTFSSLVPTEMPMAGYLEGLERGYFVISILYRKYDMLFKATFHTEEIRPLHEFGWLLFLVSRERLMNGSTDLVLMIYLLVCCLHFVVLAAPTHLLNPSYQDRSWANESNPLESPLLSRLCSLIPLPHAEVCKVYDLFREFILSVCKQTDLLQLADIKPEPGFVSLTASPPIEQLSDICGLVSDANLRDNTEALRHEYYRCIEEAPSKQTWPDEKPPQTDEFEMFKEPAASQGPRYLGGDIDETMCLQDGFLPASSPTGKDNEHISARAWSVKQLWEMVHGGRDSSGSPQQQEQTREARLQALFGQLQLDYPALVEARMHTLQANIEAAFAKLHGSTEAGTAAAEMPMRLGFKLYLHTLHNIAMAESKRLPPHLLPVFLATDSMHKGLLACAFELAIFSYGLTEINFEWLLTTLELSAYNFQKVVEPFIRHWCLSKVQVSHLGEVEETVLETLAWRTGSEIFRECQKFGVPDGKKAACKELKVKGSERHLHVFFRKFYKVASLRLASLCQLLHVSFRVYQHTWRLFEHGLAEHITLLSGRHVDQLLLCCLYGTVCLTPQRLRFLDHIIPAYRLLSMKKPMATQVYREVLLLGGQRGSIIDMYNKVFIPRVKDYILKNPVQENPKAADGAGVSPPRTSSSTGKAKKGKTQAGKVHISPLKTNRRNTLDNASLQGHHAHGDQHRQNARSICFRGIGDGTELVPGEAVGLGSGVPKLPIARKQPTAAVRPGHPYAHPQPLGQALYRIKPARKSM